MPPEYEHKERERISPLAQSLEDDTKESIARRNLIDSCVKDLSGPGKSEEVQDSIAASFNKLQPEIKAACIHQVMEKKLKDVDLQVLIKLDLSQLESIDPRKAGDKQTERIKNALDAISKH